ncbi:hypothetical protein QR685DRAFT_525364 [Neurospora intermedia]|uniref:Uncharacterized protein n=1 Tax=Neurospora intermedia TaxID=5142 RepID=A0ABR3DEF6_NEUIN
MGTTLPQPVCYIVTAIERSHQITYPSSFFSLALIQKTTPRYLEAQEVGKSPKLCSNDSSFMRYYNNCYSCTLALTEDPRDAVHDWLDYVFFPNISYCHESESIDPTWYTSTTTWATATYVIDHGPTTTVTVLVDTMVLRPDWTGFQTTTSLSPSTTTTTRASSSFQANTITSASQPSTTTNLAPDESNTREARTHGPSSWVWAIVGAVIALAIIGLGILLCSYRKGKLRFINKKKWGFYCCYCYCYF